jgi:ABC-type nitrate/sulfonate/bicarbonate transport system substrate-binding protein
LSRRPLAALAALVLPLSVLAACGDDDSADDPAGSDGPPASADPSTPTTDADVVAGQPFPSARCEANRAAGTIRYLSSFDYAATASIVEVLVADAKGYFEELCLTVELAPSFSTANYPELAANNAQFSSGGSFSEVVDFATKNEAQFVVLAVEGKTGIDGLIVKDGGPTDLAGLAGLAGSTIGVKGKITPSVAAMLAQAGLVEGTDYTTVLLDGFDPKVHIEVPEIVGFPGYKSNEPKQLEAAGVPFTLFDPAEFGIPGSFGILYTNAQFLNEHPTAAQDFVRAAMRGLADAVADPAEAAEIALGYINANGNAMFLSPEGETARWAVEAELVRSTNSRTPLGVPEPELLRDEVGTYAAIGLFQGTAPDITPFVDTSLISGVYAADGTVVWPGT